MLLNIQKNALENALNAASRALSARPSMPSLECVYLRAEDGMLIVTCTDLQMGIQTRAQADVQQEGGVLLPGKLLGEVARKLPGEDVTVSVSDNYQTSIKSGAYRTNLQGLSPEQYPALPDVDGGDTITIRQGAFADMVRQTAFAVSTENVRPILTGCLIESDDQRVNMVAVDGFRLALRRHAYDAEQGEEGAHLRCVVPGRYLSELARLLETGLLSLRITKSHLACDIGLTRVIIRLLEGEFMKYEQILPKNFKTSFVLPKDALLESVERASLLSREAKTNIVEMSVTDRSIIITAHSEFGAMREELPANIEGEEMEIAFNVRFLADMLKNIDEEDASFNLTSAISPLLVNPLEGDGFTYLVLPVRVR